MIAAVNANFAANTSASNLTPLFVDGTGGYTGTNGRKLAIPSLHLSGDGGNAVLGGASVELVYTSVANGTDLTNATIAFTTATTKVDGGGVERLFSDGSGLFIPAGQTVWLRLPNGNVAGGFRVRGDIEWQVY